MKWWVYFNALINQRTVFLYCTNVQKMFISETLNYSKKSSELLYWQLEYWQSQEGLRRALCKFVGVMFKLYQSRSKFTVKVTCLKSMALLERYGHNEHKCQIWTPSLLQLESHGQWLKVSQRSRSRAHVQNLCYHWKGPVKRNTFTKYESLIS